MKYYTNSRRNYVKGNFWGLLIPLISLIISGIGIVLTSYNNSKIFNHKYDTLSNSSGTIEFKMKHKNKIAASFISSAGRIKFGYYQEEGPVYTRYSLKMKKSVDKHFSPILINFSVRRNGDIYYGYDFGETRYSEKYDVLLEKHINIDKFTSLVFDWYLE